MASLSKKIGSFDQVRQMPDARIADLLVEHDVEILRLQTLLDEGRAPNAHNVRLALGYLRSHRNWLSQEQKNRERRHAAEVALAAQNARAASEAEALRATKEARIAAEVEKTRRHAISQQHGDHWRRTFITVAREAVGQEMFEYLCLAVDKHLTPASECVPPQPNGDTP